MKKILSLFLVLFCVFIPVTVMFARGNAEGSEGGKIQPAIYGLHSEPITNWDPSVEYSNGIHVMNNIYELLVRYNPETKKVEPELATEWSNSNEGLTWEFKLREGVKFHDGTEMDAESVKFSIDRTIRLASGASYIWDAVKEIVVVDNYTVKFDLKYNAPLDLIASTGYSAFIYSPKNLKDNDEWFQEGRDAGTGPYKLKSFTWGEEVILEQFDGYWRGWDGKHVSMVVFKKLSEPATRRQAVETGEATIVEKLPYTDLDMLKDDSNVVVDITPSMQNIFVMINTQKPPLDNKLVRQAISYAFPYQQAIDYAAGGYATQSYGAVPAGLWGFSDKVKQYTHNLDKARDLLSQAGIPNGGFKMLFTYLSGDEAEKNIAELYKSQLGKIGVELEIRSMPWDSQWELAKNRKLEERQDLFIMHWWPDMPSPYSMMYSTYHSEEEPYFNLSYYYNPVFDNLIDQANQATSFDIVGAEKMFVEAQNLLMDDAATIAVYDQSLGYVYTENFLGFKYNPAYATVVFFYDTYFK